MTAAVQMRGADVRVLPYPGDGASSANSSQLRLTPAAPRSIAELIKVCFNTPCCAVLNAPDQFVLVVIVESPSHAHSHAMHRSKSTGRRRNLLRYWQTAASCSCRTGALHSLTSDLFTLHQHASQLLSVEMTSRH